MAEIVSLWHQFAVQLDYGDKGFSLGAVTCRVELEGDIDAAEPRLANLVAVGRRVDKRGVIHDDYTFLSLQSDPLFREIYHRAMKTLCAEPERSEMLRAWRQAKKEARARVKHYARIMQNSSIST